MTISPRPRLLAFAAALALAPALPARSARAEGPPPAAAQAEAEAAGRFKKGLDLFDEGNYQGALIELRRAYDLAPKYSVLYNIGQVYFQLQDYPNALQTLERYLQEGGKKVEFKRRAEVEKDIAKLKARVASLEITVNVPDAEVTIDEVSFGKSPLPPSVLVGAGRHRVVVSRAGFASVTRVVEIASAEIQKVPVDLVETQPAVAPSEPVVIAPPPVLPPVVPVPPPPVEAPRPPPARSVPVVGWVVTGGLAAGAVVTGILALGASSDLKALRTSAAPSRDDLAAGRSKTQTLALVTDILTGCAVVSGGVTLYFTLARPTRDTRPLVSPPPGALAPPTLKVGVTPGGITLLGSF